MTHTQDRIIGLTFDRWGALTHATPGHLAREWLEAVPEAHEAAWANLEMEVRDARELARRDPLLHDEHPWKKKPVPTITHRGTSTAKGKGGIFRNDPLKRIEAKAYYPILTGETVGAGGMARCVFHDDTHPSLRCKGTNWKCFTGCGGGTIIDLGSRIYNIEPTGPGFFEIRKRLAEELLLAEVAA